MGLIRKSLAVGTVGLVNGSSKKQRVAKATERNTAAAVRLQQQEALERARERQEEQEFRYATDPEYRAFIDAKRAAEAQAELERKARNRARWNWLLGEPKVQAQLPPGE